MSKRKLIYYECCFRLTLPPYTLPILRMFLPLVAAPAQTRVSWSWLCVWKPCSCDHSRGAAGQEAVLPPPPVNAACSPYALTNAPASPSLECCGPRSSPKEREKKTKRQILLSTIFKSYLSFPSNMWRICCLSFFPRTNSRTQVRHSSETVLVVVLETLHAVILILLTLFTALDTVSRKSLLSVLMRFRIRKAEDCLLAGGTVIAGDVERIHICFLQILS